MDDKLCHYGTPRHSGRYPYGSGKRPYQGEKHITTLYSDDVDKHKTHNKYVNQIYDTMSDLEKNYISAEAPNSKPPKYYYDPKKKI